MPFVPKENREKIALTGAWDTVGDLCYMQYLPLIKKWRENPRWTTAHNATKEFFDIDDEKCARLLAFLVFFVKEVMPYEDQKVKENGDI